MLSRTLKLSEKQVKRIIGESVQAAVDTDNLIFKAAAEAGLLDSVADTSELISKFIADGVKSTNGELRNFARTYAADVSRAYEHAVDQAYLQVTNGLYTYLLVRDSKQKSSLSWELSQSKWRRRRDSNPRDLIQAKRFSRPPHSTTLPPLRVG